MQYFQPVVYVADLAISLYLGRSMILQPMYNCTLGVLLGTMSLAWTPALAAASWSGQDFRSYLFTRLILLISPLYLLNLFVAAIESCFLTPFSPRQLSYIKADHDSSQEACKSNQICLYATYFAPSNLFPLLIILAIFKSFFLPAILSLTN